jgi:hypothetical protein
MGGAIGGGVAVNAGLGVAEAVATTFAIVVGVTVAGGGFSSVGAIKINAPNAISEAKIHKIVVRLGRREDQFIFFN